MECKDWFDGIEADEYKHPVFKGVFVKNLPLKKDVPVWIEATLELLQLTIVGFSAVFSKGGVPAHRHHEGEIYLVVGCDGILVTLESATVKIPKGGWISLNSDAVHGTTGETRVLSIKFIKST